jgi:lactate dehydrogenase-like 2-hydroxyacid dehydrogenase
MPADILLIAPLPDFITAPLAQLYTVHDYHHAADKAGMLAEVGSRITGIVCAGGSVVGAALADQLPSLQIIAANGVGYDGIALDYCRARGIAVTNTPDVLTDDVADIALALVLMTSRGLVAANRALHADDWGKGANTLTTKVAGRRAGIVGLGRIGKAIAARLTVCGMEIGYHGRAVQSEVPYAFFAELLELARWCDCLVVACPGGAATRHLINAEVLAALGTAGTLINIARGSIVDEVALIEALEQGVIKTAGLDVFEHEPAVPARLLAMPQVVLLPHIGSATRETRGAMGQLVLDNLAAHYAGRALLTRVV